VFLFGAVEFVWLNQHGTKGVFESAEDDKAGDEFAASCGAKALIIEVIRQSMNTNLLKRGFHVRQLFGSDGAKHDPKPIAVKALRSVRIGHLTKVCHANGLLCQIAARAAKDSEILNGVRVPVFESAVRNPANL
jgi:hypothetical protein